MAEDIIRYSDALARGLICYFTGKPCKNGHITKRYVTNRQCATCLHDIIRNDRKNNPEKHRALNKAFCKRNPEKRKLSYRTFHAKHAEVCRKKDKERSAKKRLENPEYFREKRLRFYQSVGPEYFRINNQRYRARKLNASGSHTKADLDEILTLQKNKCAMCKTKFTASIRKNLDHIISLSRGGSNDRKNLQYLCAPCNFSKNARDPIDFARSRGMLL